MARQVHVDPAWRHARGPLEDLLRTQQGGCGMCHLPASWVVRRDGTTRCTLDQVADPATGLLLALVCRLCLKTLRSAFDVPSRARPACVVALLLDPPARRCVTTVHSTPLTTARRLAQDVSMPTENPTERWRYYGSVIHCLFLWQRQRCAICDGALTVNSASRAVHVDHDPYLTGDPVRGILCRRCNVCEGQPTLGDSWWGRFAPVLAAYRATPPATRCPDTLGLGMSGRFARASITRAVDGGVLLGHQVLLLPPPVGDAPPRRH